MILAYVTAGPLLTTLSETGERSPDFAAGGAQTKLYLRGLLLESSATLNALDAAASFRIPVTCALTLRLKMR